MPRLLQSVTAENSASVLVSISVCLSLLAATCSRHVAWGNIDVIFIIVFFFNTQTIVDGVFV